MQTIPFKLAKAGMVLAKDVLKPDASSAMPICGKGMVLTDSLIERMGRMGVARVTVQGHPVMVEGEATLEQQLARLDARFKRHEGDPLMRKMKEIYQRLIIRMMET
jgi:hypothetical protein